MKDGIVPGVYQSNDGDAKRIFQSVRHGQVFYRIKGLFSVAPLECSEREFIEWLARKAEQHSESQH